MKIQVTYEIDIGEDKSVVEDLGKVLLGQKPLYWTMDAKQYTSRLVKISHVSLQKDNSDEVEE